jgi:crotonobetainyl-CoA:carnitine CoA-transferase CaiB-like acyl-CoA transferase
MSDMTTSGHSPLEGTNVIDLSLGMAGPFAAARLGDLGARVVKVEPLTGDPARGFGPPFVGDDAAVFHALNRGKASIAVDVDCPEGADLVRKLMAEADVVIEDLGPGRAGAAGLDYDDVAADHPALIYVAISAWGDEGPLADQPGAELPVQAMAEYLASLGRIGDPPVRLGADVAGLNTGVFASQAALGALVARDVSGLGRGQRVAVSMLGSLLHLRGIMWTARSNPDDWWGFHLDHYTNPPETGYGTADGQVFFGLRRGNSEDFDQLMISLGLVEHIADPVFSSFGRDAAPLGRHSVEAKPIWEKGFSSLTTDEVVDLFHERGGDAVPFTDYPLITSHPQTQAIEALCEVPLPGGGSMRGVSPVWKFSETPAQIAGPAPQLGQHTDELLRKLGLGAEEIQAMRGRGIVGGPAVTS